MLLVLFSAPSGGAERARITVMDPKINAPKDMEYLGGAYIDMISSRLEMEGGFVVVDHGAVQESVVVTGLVDITDDTRKLLAGVADYVLHGSLSVVGETLSMDMKLTDLKSGLVHSFSEKGRGVDAFMDMVDRLANGVAAITMIGDTTGASAFGKEREALKKGHPHPEGNGDFLIVKERDFDISLWKSRSLPSALKSLEVADLDGDGEKEVVLLDDDSLYIYSFEGGVLKLRRKIKGELPYVNHGITSGDLNENGLPEIYLARTYRHRSSSGVIEFGSGGFNFIATDVPWLLRVLDTAGREPLLIGERFREADGFYGGVKILYWDGGTLKDGGLLDIPGNKRLYGFAIRDINGDGRDDFLCIDDDNRLRLYEKSEGVGWREIWKSRNYFGGSLNRITYGATEPSYQEERYARIDSRILGGRGDDIGMEDIIVTSNEPGGLGRLFKNVTSYESGEIYGLAWNGVGLDERWRTKRISGYIADYLVTDIDSDGGKDLVILVVSSLPSLLKSGESYLIVEKMGHIRR